MVGVYIMEKKKTKWKGRHVNIKKCSDEEYGQTNDELSEEKPCEVLSLILNEKRS